MKFLSRLISLPRLLVSVVVLLLTTMAFFSEIPFLELMELKTVDLRYLSRGPIPTSGKAVMAIVDEKSLEAEGRWPWPRSKIALLVDALSQNGAKVIGFDIGFLDPDENTSLKTIQAFREKAESLALRDPRFLDFMDAYREKTDNDLLLAEAIRRSSADVVLGHFFHMHKEDLNYEIAPSDIERRLEQIALSRYLKVRFVDDAPGLPPMITAFAPQANLDLFSEAADSSGFFNKIPDIGRRRPLGPPRHALRKNDLCPAGCPDDMALFGQTLPGSPGESLWRSRDPIGIDLHPHGPARAHGGQPSRPPGNL